MEEKTEEKKGIAGAQEAPKPAPMEFGKRFMKEHGLSEYELDDLFKRVPRIADKILDHEEKGSFPRYHALQQAGAGRFNNAFDLVSRMTRGETSNYSCDYHFAAITLCDIAILQTRAGIDSAYTFARAENAARNAGCERDDALIQLGVEPCSWGLFPSPPMNDALKYVAIGQAVTGQFDRAIKTALLIDYPPKKAEALRDIAVKQAKAGIDPTQTFAQAIQAASQAEPSYRMLALHDIAIEQAKAKQFAQVIQTALTIENLDWREAALSKIKLLQAGGAFPL